MAWGVNDCAAVLLGLEFVESDVDGDTSVSLGLEFVQNPSVGKRSFSLGFGLFLIFLKSSLVESSALDNEMSGGSGLS